MPLADLVQHDSPLGRWAFARWCPAAPLQGCIDLFHEQVGMAPKRYARIVRLNALLKEVSSSNWADLAARFGYYDQPHFVREFREFSGTTPTGFLRARGPDGDSVVLDA